MTSIRSEDMRLIDLVSPIKPSGFPDSMADLFFECCFWGLPLEVVC